MHEMGVAQEIVEAIAARTGGAPVARVLLEVGRLSGVAPDSLRFCLEFCADGTVLEGTAVEIVEVPGLGRCRTCSGDVALDSYFGYCRCGSSELDLVGGDEIKVLQIEAKRADEQPPTG